MWNLVLIQIINLFSSLQFYYLKQNWYWFFFNNNLIYQQSGQFYYMLLTIHDITIGMLFCLWKKKKNLDCKMLVTLFHNYDFYYSLFVNISDWFFNYKTYLFRLISVSVKDNFNNLVCNLCVKSDIIIIILFRIFYYYYKTFPSLFAYFWLQMKEIDACNARIFKNAYVTLKRLDKLSFPENLKTYSLKGPTPLLITEHYFVINLFSTHSNVILTIYSDSYFTFWRQYHRVTISLLLIISFY